MVKKCTNPHLFGFLIILEYEETINVFVELILFQKAGIIFIYISHLFYWHDEVYGVFSNSQPVSTESPCISYF